MKVEDKERVSVKTGKAKVETETLTESLKVARVRCWTGISLRALQITGEPFFSFLLKVIFVAGKP